MSHLLALLWDRCRYPFNSCHKGVKLCSCGRGAMNPREIRGGTWSTKHVFWVCYVASATFIFVSGSTGDVTDSTQLMHSAKHVPPLPLVSLPALWLALRQAQQKGKHVYLLHDKDRATNLASHGFECFKGFLKLLMGRPANPPESATPISQHACPPLSKCHLSWVTRCAKQAGDGVIYT